MRHEKNNGRELGKRGMTVEVKGSNIDSAIRTLKRRMMQEGVIRDMRRTEFYEPPTVKKRRAAAEARLRHLRRLKQKANEA